MGTMILNNLEQLKSVVPTTAGIDDWNDMVPYVKSAEVWINNNVLGAALYELLMEDDPESSMGIEATDPDLMLLCRSVVGNHAYWDAIPFLDIVHTNQGFAVISATNKVPASKERVERLREQCLIRRDNEVENLIAWLEDHEEYHDEWKGSPAYSVMTDALIRTATELKKFAEWDGTRSEFLKLRPKMIQMTMVKLEPLFSKDYVDELIEKQRDTELNGDDAKVAVLLKYALANLVTGSIEAAEKIAGDALRYIDKNLTKFGTYTNSAEYKVRVAAGYENSADATIFASLFI